MRQLPLLLATLLAASAAGPAKSGLFGRVNARTAAEIGRVLRSPQFTGTGPLETYLKTLDLDAEVPPRAIAPVVAALESLYPRGVETFDAAALTLALQQASRLVEETGERQIHVLRAAQAFERLSDAGLAETHQELEVMTRDFAPYLSKTSLDSLSGMKGLVADELARRTSDRAKNIIRQTTADWREKEVSIAREDPDRNPEPPRSKTPAAQRSSLQAKGWGVPGASRPELLKEAEDAIRRLGAASSLSTKAALVRELQGRALARDGKSVVYRGLDPRELDSAVQDMIVVALIRDLWDSDDARYARQVTAALVEIGRRTPFPEVRELVLRGLREDKRVGDESARLRELDEAVALLEKPLPPSPFWKDRLRKLDLGPGPSYFDQLVEGVKRNPGGAVLNLIAFIASAFLAGQVPLGLVAGLALAIAMLSVTARGLYTGSWAANALQLFLIGSFWQSALLVPTAASLIGLIPVTALWGAVASYSYRFQRPATGWALNWALIFFAGWLLTGLPAGFNFFGGLAVWFLLNYWQRAKAL